MMTIAERVAKGAALLDKIKPGWPARLDVSTISYGPDSVLAQIYGSSWYRDPDFPLVSVGDIADHGFATTTREWPDLANEWRRVIEAHLEATS
jgi:hypothetical protein